MLISLNDLANELRKKWLFAAADIFLKHYERVCACLNACSRVATLLALFFAKWRSEIGKLLIMRVAYDRV